MYGIAERYLKNALGLRSVAAFELCSDLMRGDPAKFKAGYSPENALIATAEAFGLSDEEVDKIGREDLGLTAAAMETVARCRRGAA